MGLISETVNMFVLHSGFSVSPPDMFILFCCGRYHWCCRKTWWRTWWEGGEVFKAIDQIFYFSVAHWALSAKLRFLFYCEKMSVGRPVAKHVINCWMDCCEIWGRHSRFPEDDPWRCFLSCSSFQRPTPPRTPSVWWPVSPKLSPHDLFLWA